VPWLRVLQAEHHNLLGALRFACDTGDAATAVELASALGLFWTINGNHAEAAHRLRLALEVPGETATGARTVATVFYLLNTVLSGGSRIVIGRMPRRARPADGETAHPAVTLLEPSLAVFTNDNAGGVAAVDRLLAHPDPWTRAMLHLMRVFLQGGIGGIAAMSRDLTAAVATFREAGERWGLAESLTYLAYDRITVGDFDSAVSGLEESIRLRRELDPADDAGLQRVLLAVAHVHGGEVDRARALLLDLVAPGVARSSVGSLVYARITLGDLARCDGDLEEAAHQYTAADDDLRRAPLDAPPFRAMLASAMGQLATARDDLTVARRHLADAIALSAEVPDPPITAGIAIAVARLCARRGAAGDAAEILGAAHALRGAPDSSNPDVSSLAAELRKTLGQRAYQASYTYGSELDGAAALAHVTAHLR
jgi:hypothetical protein